MPTYTVTNSNFNLSSKQQKNLAEGITKVHNVVTGANTYFAQVIFNKTKKDNHFMGGKKVKEPSLFLLGQIRAGRSKEVKDKLISDLKDILVKNYHLSYPFIYKFKKNYYLIPETHENKRLEIYIAVNFPFKWKLFRTALEGKTLVDPTLISIKNNLSPIT